jgi:hypothetical protein
MVGLGIAMEHSQGKGQPVATRQCGRRADEWQQLGFARVT